MFCPKENLPLIKTSHLKQYVTSHFTPQRMAIAGCGVDHSQLVELAQEHFLEPRRSWEVDPLPVDESIAQYTGGEKTVSKGGKQGELDWVEATVCLPSCSSCLCVLIS